MAAGRGKGRGSCKQTFCGDGMLYVWLVVLIMVLAVFILVAATGRGRVDSGPGGPWWAWMIAVVVLLFIFIIVYMISMQYAEPALAAYNKSIRLSHSVEKKKKEKGAGPEAENMV